MSATAIHLIWVVLLYSLHCNARTGPTCFKCDDVTVRNSCSKEVTCQSDEVCFAERMLDTSSQSRYFYGCQKRQVCQAIDSGSGVLGRREMRRDGVETFILACMQCCYTDRCNLRLCQQNSVPSKLTVVVQPRSAEAVQGHSQDVVFSCSIRGVPNPQVLWFYRGPEGKVHALQAGFTTSGASSNLTIQDPKVSDSGTYICTAINKQGTEEASATLTVHALFKPVVTMSRPHVVAGSPNPLRIHCDSRGSTNVSYSWKVMHHGGRNVTMKLNSDTVILNPATTANVGVFTCFVTNSVGRESGSLEVHVEVLEAPAIDVHPNTTIREGDSSEARLTCESIGHNNASMAWSSDSKLLKQATGVNRLEHVIHDPRVHDTGNYTCTVSKDNVTKSASVHLAVFASAKCYQAGTLDQPVPFEEAVDNRTNSTCSMEAPYCISVITASGGHHSNFNVYQGCASATACDQSSDRMNPRDEPCFHGIVGWMTYPDDLLCTFCCTEDFCSENFEPDSATVYKTKTSP